VHYSEIALKGRNRPDFVRILKRNIRRVLAHLEPEIESREGRLIVTVEAVRGEVAPRLSTVFGIAWFSRARVMEADYDRIRDAVLEAATSAPGSSFMLDPRRTDKSFPMTSMELAKRLGAEVRERTGKRVDLSEPDVPIHVDIVRGRSFVYYEKTKGPTKLVRVLSAWGGKTTLVLIPFAEYQIAAAGVPPELEPSLFRRFMRMTAEALAPSFSASAVSTGDSLSQAASQTLWNLGAFDAGASLPILRPLLTYDKDEVVSLARRIGTYQLSLEEYKDCCAIISRHPRTKAKAGMITEYAKDLRFESLAWKSAELGALVSYSPASDELKVVPLGEAIRRASLREGPARVSGVARPG